LVVRARRLHSVSAPLYIKKRGVQPRYLNEHVYPSPEPGGETGPAHQSSGAEARQPAAQGLAKILFSD